MTPDMPKSGRSDPLGFMTQLSPSVRVYRPTKTAPPNSTAPRLIVLFGWMDARPSPIAKYVRTYQETYPDAQILVVSSSLLHFLSPPATLTSNIPPALPVIRDFVATNTQQSRPNVLLHVFSNAGSATMGKLRAAYGPDFPSHVTIFDSSPGLASFNRDVGVITSGLSPVMKVLSLPFVSILILLYYVSFLGREDGFTHQYRTHNESTNEARRVYIYSKADRVVDFNAVERHAKLAEDKGFSVRREIFQGTQHVMHMKADEERYWKIIRDTWEG